LRLGENRWRGCRRDADRSTRYADAFQDVASTHAFMIGHEIPPDMMRAVFDFGQVLILARRVSAKSNTRFGIHGSHGVRMTAMLIVAGIIPKKPVEGAGACMRHLSAPINDRGAALWSEMRCETNAICTRCPRAS
jgi:hypothetical protein